MKKLYKILVALVISLTTIFSLSACGDPEITGASVKSGLKSYHVKGREFITDNVVVEAKWDNGDKKQYSGKDLSFGTIPNTVGTHKLEITIEPIDYTFEYSIRVLLPEDQLSSVNLLESNLVKEFNANRSIVPSDFGASTINYEGFMVRSQTRIEVGDDNDFNFRLSAAGVDAGGDLATGIVDVRTNVKVEQIGGTSTDPTYTELTGTALTNTVAIENVNAVLNFTEAAIDNSYRITVTAANPDTDYELNNYSFSAEVTVKDGFNVYDVTDLSVYDNHYEGWAEHHEEVKSRYNMTNEDIANIKALYLQDEIMITKDAVRQDMFWGSGADASREANFNTYQTELDEEGITLAGTPYNRSGDGVFFRKMTSGTFGIYGNYFGVNASEFPLCVEDHGTLVKPSDGEMITTYLCLFHSAPSYDTDDEVRINNSNTKLTYANMSFTGNGEMSGDTRNSGALLMMRNRDINFEGYNTVSNNFYITYYFELGGNRNDNDGNYVVNSCRGYNSYQTLVYSWGGENTTIINSEFRNAGGPAILMDCLDEDQVDQDVNRYNDGQFGPTLNLVGSFVESRLSGKEPWFTEYGAGSYVGLIVLMDLFLDGTAAATTEGAKAGYMDTNTTIIADKVSNNTVPRINIQAVIMKGGEIVTNTQQLAGGVYVFNNHENLEDNLLDYYKHYGINGQTQQSTTHGLDMDGYLSSVAQNIPILESALTGGYVGAPLDINNNGELNEGMFIEAGFITGKNFLGMANMALNGIYKGIYDAVTSTPAFADFELPRTDEQFATMPAANRLAILEGVLQAMANLQMPIAKDSPLEATAISGFVDTMYGMVGAIAPAESWRGIQGLADSITAIVESEDELSVKFEKLTAVYSAIGAYTLPTTWSALQTKYLNEFGTATTAEAKVLALHNAISVVKGSTLMSALTSMMTYANSITGENNYGAGSYLNLYFNAGRMGALVGLYPAPDAE